MSKSYIKQAEQNVLNQAKFWSEAIEAFASIGDGLQHKLDHYSPGKEDFQEGIRRLIQGAYKEQQHALARCFALVGVGGEEAQAYARQRAKEVFDAKYSTMEWLDTWGRLPGRWLTEDREGFRAELDEKLEQD
jgi:hypothetical protein